MRTCLYETVTGGNEHKRSRWKKAMMGQRRENWNAFFPMDFPWITGRSPLSRKKDKYTILPVQTRDGSFLKILCAKKSLGHPLPFYKQSKTGQEELGQLGTSMFLNLSQRSLKLNPSNSDFGSSEHLHVACFHLYDVTLSIRI